MKEKKGTICLDEYEVKNRRVTYDMRADMTQMLLKEDGNRKFSLVPRDPSRRVWYFKVEGSDKARIEWIEALWVGVLQCCR